MDSSHSFDRPIMKHLILLPFISRNTPAVEAPIIVPGSDGGDPLPASSYGRACLGHFLPAFVADRPGEVISPSGPTDNQVSIPRRLYEFCGLLRSSKYALSQP